MSINNFDVISAIWARLDGQLSQDVYSHVPQNAAYPYIAIGPATIVAEDTKTTDMVEYTFQIDSWNKNVSSLETVADMMQAVRDVLHKQESNISIVNHIVVLSRIEFEQLIQEGSSGVGGDHFYHGVQRLRITVEAV